jgi:hypothetical protein
MISPERNTRMKMLKYTILAVLVVAALVINFVPTRVAHAQDRTDNKLVIWGVPRGSAVKVAQPGSEFPRGEGDQPGLDGSVIAYAPLNRTSQVWLYNGATGATSVIATVHPTSTWPDTTLYAPQYAGAFPNFGLASPLPPSGGFAGPLPQYAPPQQFTPVKDGDNKLLVTGIPQGWAVHVAQPGGEFPRGDGSVPDGSGTAVAYAPLDRTSHVYVWDPIRSRFSMIATVRPTSTWPDTVVRAPAGLTQGFSAGLASPMQTIPGEPYVPIARGSFAPAPSQFGNEYVVQRGDTLGMIARLYGTTIADLAAVNNIPNANLIFPGQILLVP